MMKKIVNLLMILMFSMAFSQNEKVWVQLEKPARVISKDSVYTSVDQYAEFPGGIDRFRREFANNFDASSIKGSGKFRCELSFVILEDGQITNVLVKGTNDAFNTEAKRALISIKNNIWIPGKINEKPVKSLFRMPLNMVFE